MNLSSLWGSTKDYVDWLAAATASALAAGWAAKRRHANGAGTGPPLRDRLTGSWLRRRLAVERSLATCDEERQNDRLSFERQLAAAKRELAEREAEIAYLMAKTGRLMAEGRKVVEAVDHASAAPSVPSDAASTSSPTISPTSPPRSPTSPARGRKSTRDR